MTYPVVIAGAGAAGLLAAGRAAQKGAQVLLLEKMKLPGRKIGISGKGRCNLTNTASLQDFIHHFGKNGRFLHQPFSRFFSKELTELFTERNLPVQIERGGRVFPAEGKRGVDVVKTLELWVKELGVEIRSSTTLLDILVENNQISGVKTNKGIIGCSKLIMATGGATYPRTGSTGDGYRLLEQLGHTLIALRPALVPLLTTPRLPTTLNGLQLKNIKARLFINNKRKTEQFGELYFVDSALSGPVVLTMSLNAVDALKKSKDVSLLVDLKPALSDIQLDKRLQNDLIKRNKEPISSILRGLLPGPLVQFCLAQTHINPTVNGSDFSGKDRKKLVTWMKNIRFEISGYGSMDEAIVTAGGIKLKEIDPNTMQSKKVKGLYITGELLDLNGDTGGFNLQAAFSTGWIAGESAACDK